MFVKSLREHDEAIKVNSISLYLRLFNGWEKTY